MKRGTLLVFPLQQAEGRGPGSIESHSQWRLRRGGHDSFALDPRAHGPQPYWSFHIGLSYR